MITIKMGAVYSYISTDESSLAVWKDLKSYMRARPEGYGMSSAYRNGIWDGWKNYITDAGRVLTGLLPHCIKYLNKREAEFQMSEGNSVAFNQIVTDYRTESGVITLRDYAVTGIQNLINGSLSGQPFQRGIISAAPNAGKTAIIVNTVRSMAQPSALITVHRVEIYKQLVQAFERNGVKVGRIDSKVKDPQAVTVATVQSLNTYLFPNGRKNIQGLTWLKQFQLLIVDESHTASSDTYQKVIKQMDAPARLFLSGSALSSSDTCAKLDCIGLSGGLLLEVSYEDTIEMGVSLRPIVHIHSLFDNSVTDEMIYLAKLDALYESRELFRKVVNLVQDDKYTLITVEHMAAGTVLYNHLKNKCNVEFTHGSDPERERKLNDFRDGKLKVLIGTMILKEGVNLPLIQRLVRADFGKSKIKTEQLVGRAVRLNGNETTVEVHDFYVMDEMLEKHSQTRIKHYKSLGFEVLPDDGCKKKVKN